MSFTQNEADNAIVITRVNTSEGFYDLRKAWNTILDKSSLDSYFLRWEWLWEWWQAYAEERFELCIFTVVRNGALIGIAPFYVKRYEYWNKLVSGKRLMWLGTSEGSVISEYMSVIVDNGEDDFINLKILEKIKLENICDDIYLHKIDRSSKFFSSFSKAADHLKFKNKILNVTESPYIKIPSSMDEFMKGLSGSMRYHIRRKQRVLENNHDKVVFRKTESLEELEKDLQVFIQLHQMRWNYRNMPGSFSMDRFLRFQKAVMKKMFENGHLELCFLSVDDRAVAALYNIKYNGKIFFFQAGMDTEYDPKLSPGTLLHQSRIEKAVEEGISEYDFLGMGSDDNFKKSWTKNFRPLCDMYLTRSKILYLMSLGKSKQI